MRDTSCLLEGRLEARGVDGLLVDTKFLLGGSLEARRVYGELVVYATFFTVARLDTGTVVTLSDVEVGIVGSGVAGGVVVDGGGVTFLFLSVVGKVDVDRGITVVEVTTGRKIDLDLSSIVRTALVLEFNVNLCFVLVLFGSGGKKTVSLFAPLCRCVLLCQQKKRKTWQIAFGKRGPSVQYWAHDADSTCCAQSDFDGSRERAREHVKTDSRDQLLAGRAPEHTDCKLGWY